MDKKKIKVCSYAGCLGIYHAKDKCNKHYKLEYYRIYRKTKKDICRKAEKSYLQRNPVYRAAKSTAFKKLIKRAMPKWVNRKDILEFYKNRPKGYHVDHIVPLRGKEVCGLHVLWNLQYLTIEENSRKGNKFSGT